MTDYEMLTFLRRSFQGRLDIQSNYIRLYGREAMDQFLKAAATGVAVKHLPQLVHKDGRPAVLMAFSDIDWAIASAAGNTMDNLEMTPTEAIINGLLRAGIKL